MTGNYNDTAGTVDDKINQAYADCSSISGYTVTYDGNAHTATGSCKDLGGNDLPGSTSAAPPTPTPAPTTPTKNHEHRAESTGYKQTKRSQLQQPRDSQEQPSQR